MPSITLARPWISSVLLIFVLSWVPSFSSFAQETKSELASAMAFNKGRDLLATIKEDTAQETLRKALEAFQRSDELSPGPCLPCRASIAFTAERLGKAALALEAADRGLAMKDRPLGLPGYEMMIAHLHRVRGMSLLLLEPDRDLEEVQRELATALEWMPPEMAGEIYTLRSNLASVLDLQGKLDEALRILPTPPPSPPVQAAEERPLIPGPESREVTPPRKVAIYHPQYSEVARIRRLQGLVTLRAIITATGEVTKPEILKGLPGLNAQALRTVETWKFEPARKDGEPVAVYYQLDVHFKLE